MAAIFTRLRHAHDPARGVDESDAMLVRRGLREREAFAVLRRRCLEEIARFCRLRLGDEEAARDAMQHVFAPALAALPCYQERGQCRPGLSTIARHVLTNQAHRRRPMTPLDAALDAAEPGQTPEDLASAALGRHAVLAAPTCLPQEQRLVVELRLAGLSGPEAAAAMGRSHDAVKKRRLRALERLRVALLASAELEEACRGA